MSKYELLQIEEYSQALAFLNETDYKAIKFAEGLITEEEYAPVRLQRQNARKTINDIEERYK